MDGSKCKTSKCKTKRLVAWLFLAVWSYVVITPVTAFDKIIRLAHNNDRQEEICMHELNESSYKAEAELPSGNKESSKPNFSSPLSRSQFL